MFLKINTVNLGLSALLISLILCCEKPAEHPTIWFKGNTHAHTTICGHADTPPDSVALWYLDRGYHFLILSEHNHFIDPDSVNLPTGRRSDFILIPGEEVTGQKHIHTTGMNIQSLVEEGSQLMTAALERPDTETKTEIMQRHTDDILEAGGLPILNHPNWYSGAQPYQILPVERLHMLELYNGHPDVNNWGAEDHRPVEEKWDSLLTAGMLVLGVSSDDAHHFKEWTSRTSNPGRGWVMVNSAGMLTADAITAAMAQGDFYASNGVILSRLKHNSREYELAIDTAQTFKELASPFVTGKIEATGKEGFVISFITGNGEILQSSSQLEALYKISSGTGYVRAKISYTRKNSDGMYESFFAWTQPQFLDDRAQLLNSGQLLKGHSHE